MRNELNRTATRRTPPSRNLSNNKVTRKRPTKAQIRKRRRKRAIARLSIFIVMLIGLFLCIRPLFHKSLQAKRKEIQNNSSSYTDSLVRLATEKDELVDFVYNYPKNKDKYKNKQISIKEDYKGNGFPLFIQWDDRWGYDRYGDDLMALNGCAPTAMAMAIVGLTGNTDVNPRVLAQYSLDNREFVAGVGTNWKFVPEAAEHYGLKSKELPVTADNIKSTLQSNTPIIITVGPGHFTTTGHFMLLTGLDSDGKVILNDPFSKVRSGQTWDIDIFIKEAKAMWSLSK